MKKKKWLIPVVAIVFVFALFFALIILMINKGYGISKGRYLEAKNGQTMLILDNSPINMSNRTGKDLFDNIWFSFIHFHQIKYLLKYDTFE